MKGLTDEQEEQYEKQLAQLDSKALLATIAAELGQIRMLLQDDAKSPTDEREAQMYQCQMCGEVVGQDERRDHGIVNHKAPPDLALESFDKV